MTRWLLTVALVIVAMATALAVIHTRHESRKSFVELQALESQRDELNVDWGRLQLEHATWAEASRVESKARSEMDLVHKQPERVIVVVEQAEEGQQ